MNGCDVIEDWDDTEFSGPGGRLGQLEGLIDEFMGRYGFAGSDVMEQHGLMDDEGVPARYDPDSNTIYFDADYLAGSDITPDEAVYLAYHESIHAMDALEDGGIDVGEAAVAKAAYELARNDTDDCESEEPESGGDTGDTGGW